MGHGGGLDAVAKREVLACMGHAIPIMSHNSIHYSKSNCYVKIIFAHLTHGACSNMGPVQVLLYLYLSFHWHQSFAAQ